MPKFVITDYNGSFLKKNIGTYSTIEWVDDIDKARIFNRKCDASNFLSCRPELREEVEVRAVQLTLVEG